MAVVPGCLLDHVVEDPAKGGLGPVTPGHLVKRGGGSRYDPALLRHVSVERDEICWGLAGIGAELALGVVAVGVPEGPPCEDLLEPPSLYVGEMFDQAEQRGAGWDHRPAKVLVRHPVELPDQHTSVVVEPARERFPLLQWLEARLKELLVSHAESLAQLVGPRETRWSTSDTLGRLDHRRMCADRCARRSGCQRLIR